MSGTTASRETPPGAALPPVALAPLPAAVTATGAAPFELTARTPIHGDADGIETLRTLLAARTGADSGPFRSTSEHDGPADPSAAITLAIEAGEADGAPESYRLSASATGITVTGSGAAGLFYGIQTLGQLIARDGDRWIVPAVEIADAPRFAYRGLMLDLARHFHGVETIRACIDRAASLKLNHLHLHLTDDQGWRIELTSRPELTARASATAVGGDAGGFLSQRDFREIVAYAARRHMTVVPEIDIPGHTHAVSLAYPELCEQPVLSDHIREVVRDYGGALPENGVAYDGMAVGFSSLKIRDEATYAFLDDVFGELATLTPGPYLHLGGDEALGTAADDFAFFVERASAIVTGLGKTPVAWHEAGAATGLAPGTIGQYWGFVTPTDGMDERARTFVRGGGRIILSPADAVYLDMKFDADSPLGLTWARGVTSAQRAYEWEPTAVIAGVTDADILGVEAPLWTETVRDLDDIDALAFPRIAAAAEAAWSPAVGTAAERTWASFRARVGGLAPLWRALGIRFTPLPEIDWADDTAAR